MAKQYKALVLTSLVLSILVACSEDNSTKPKNTNLTNDTSQESAKSLINETESDTLNQNENNTETAEAELKESLVSKESDIDAIQYKDSDSKEVQLDSELTDDGFKPHVQDAIDKMNGVSAPPDNYPVEIKEEYQKVADLLEKQMPTN